MPCYSVAGWLAALPMRHCGWGMGRIGSDGQIIALSRLGPKLGHSRKTLPTTVSVIFAITPEHIPPQIQEQNPGILTAFLSSGPRAQSYYISLPDLMNK